MEVTGQNVLYV